MAPTPTMIEEPAPAASVAMKFSLLGEEDERKGKTEWQISTSWPRALFLAITAHCAKALANCYLRSMEDMLQSPDWSISRIIVYPYNKHTAFYEILPSFLAMVVLYAVQHRHKEDHIRQGALCAFVSAPFIFAFDVVQFNKIHYLSVVVLCLGAWKWKRDLTLQQANFALVGFAMGFSGVCLNKAGLSDVGRLLLPVGEIVVLSTWVSMIYNQ